MQTIRNAFAAIAGAIVALAVATTNHGYLAHDGENVTDTSEGGGR